MVGAVAAGGRRGGDKPSFCHEPCEVAGGHGLTETRGLRDVRGRELIFAGEESQDLRGSPGEVPAWLSLADTRHHPAGFLQLGTGEGHGEAADGVGELD